MPAVHLSTLPVGHSGPIPVELRGKSVVAASESEAWHVVVIERGMTSGQPAVAIIVDTPAGVVVLQTSLGALLTAAAGARGMAEAQFGWTQPA